MKSFLVVLALTVGALAALETSAAERKTQVQQKSVVSAGVRAQAAGVGRELARNPVNQAGLRALLSGQTGADMTAMLFFVFRESVTQMNEDKRYWLEKLKQYNETANALHDYLNELNDAMQEINDAIGEDGGGHGGDHCGEGGGGTAAGVQRVTSRLEKAIGLTETQIQRLTPEARGSADVRGLQASLSRDRKLIALARREFSRAARVPIPVKPAVKERVSPVERREPAADAVAPIRKAPQRQVAPSGETR